MLNTDKIKHLFFDLDDTLIITQPVYIKSNMNTAKLVHKLLNTKYETVKSIYNQFSKIDIDNIKHYGVKLIRTEISWIETYKFLAKKHFKTISESDIDKIKYQANEVFRTKINPYPYTHLILDKIKNLGFEMNILTLGEDEMQNKRIDDANLRSYFDNIYVVPDKNKKSFKEVLNGRDPVQSAMIGNSLKSDIKPALQNNMKAIHMDRKTWAYDFAKIDKNHINYIPISNIEDLYNLLTKNLSYA